MVMLKKIALVIVMDQLLKMNAVYVMVVVLMIVVFVVVIALLAVIFVVFVMVMAVPVLSPLGDFK